MLRKKVILSSIMITAACLCSACTGKKADEPGVQTTEQSQVTASDSANSDVEANIQTTKQSQATASGVTDNQINTDVENGVENLTQNTIQGACVGIDYEIYSYEDVQKFGYQLFAQNIEEKNPVLSPVSAYLALSMAGCGANGATGDEFRNVLGDMEVFSDDMVNSLAQNGDVLNLSIANSAWIDDEFIVEDDWLGIIQSLMHAEAFQADLSTTEAMNSMNHWIARQTNGMIDNMIEKPLDAWTRLVLFDTIYFKGKWETPFEAENTHQENFYTDPVENVPEQSELCGLPTADASKSTQGIASTTEQVDMMNLYMTYLDCISNDFAEGVILPYQNNANDTGHQDINLALIALKPTNDESIRDVYRKLTPDVLNNMLRDRQNELVHLKLPKFAVTFDQELNESLMNMGLKACFDPEKADFTSMGRSKYDANLYISLVRQKAKIIVDEEGTEAAAATEIEMRDGGGFIADPKELYFNEPFLYMIMDMDRELPLFIGILDDPKGE